MPPVPLVLFDLAAGPAAALRPELDMRPTDGWRREALAPARADSEPARQAGIARALARAGVQPADAVVLVDAPAGVAAAHASGAAALGFAGGDRGTRAALMRAGADWVCDDGESVRARLEGWLGDALPASREALLARRRAPRGRPNRIEPTAPGECSVWDFPRPPRLVGAAPVRVEHGGARLAESRRAWRVEETSSPPTYYVPSEDVRTEELTLGGTPTLCEWKGRAQYWCWRHASGPPIAWSYPEPLPGFEALRDHLAFFAARVHACFVGDERALPQPGDYYGGWITRDVKGPFKGVPGSEHW